MTMPANQLPSAGSGGPGRSTHLPFLLVLGVTSALVGGICALFGWRKAAEPENDGVSSMLVPIHWLDDEAPKSTKARIR